MKILIFPLLLICIAVAFYKAGLNRKNKVWLVGALALTLFFVVLGIQFVDSINAPDMQCGSVHTTTSVPPTELKTATDYLNLGDYHYDLGSCSQALADYSKALELQPEFPEALDNRAYTYMRMHEYFKALPDLDAALALRPTYVEALMNRGDIYNFYLPDRAKAISDYQRVISLQGFSGTSVCGHLFLAQHNGWNLESLLTFPFTLTKCSNH